MLAPEITPDGNAPSMGTMFGGLLSDVARATLRKAGYPTMVPSSEKDIDDYLRDATRLWVTNGDGSIPEPTEVRRVMEGHEAMLYEVWKLALRHDTSPEEMPLVVQAPLLWKANPFVVRSSKLEQSVVVMSEGLWSLIAAAVFGVLLWADGPSELEDFGRSLVSKAGVSWALNQPELGPSGTDMARALVADLEISNFAIGIAHAGFTWTFLHEMGHVMLGHLAAAEHVRGSALDGSAEIIYSEYDRNDEVEADKFGFQRFLSLMPLELEIRKMMPFGPQIDHAPLIMMDLLDLAMRVGRRDDLLTSKTHPPPLTRLKILREIFGPQLSQEGRDFFAYWTERSSAIRKLLLPSL